MEITVAKTSGFCFGVNRAVKTVESLLEQNKKVATLGPIIHNPQVVSDFEKRGVKIVTSPEYLNHDSTLVVRSHGITRQSSEYIKNNNLDCVDATCPFVKKIHNIVSENKNNRKILLAAGNANHPEMIGICSYFSGEYHVFSNLIDLKNIIEEHNISNEESILVISQTTFSKNEWQICTNFIKNMFTNIDIYDTICNTTNLRQQEAEFLSNNSDLMIVVGGKTSSNTLKLFELCKKSTQTILIESENDLPNSFDSNIKKVGIVAGASTPLSIVDRVVEKLQKG